MCRQSDSPFLLAMLAVETGLQPVPSLSTCLSAQPGSSLLAMTASGHQVAFLQLRRPGSTASDAVDNAMDGGTATSTDSDSSSCLGALEAEVVLRLGFGASNNVCCAAWDASGEWLAIGTAQQLHLFHRQADSVNVVPMGSTQLRFAPKVWAVPPIQRTQGWKFVKMHGQRPWSRRIECDGMQRRACA